MYIYVLLRQLFSLLKRDVGTVRAFTWSLSLSQLKFLK